MQINVLGICGSPIRGGNVQALLEEELKTAGEHGEVNTEMILLADSRIEDCRHCNWCLSKQEEGKYCSIKDDMLGLYPKIVEADVLLLATPAYACRLSGYMATFMDRFRALLLGKRYRGVLDGKVGGALTVAWRRNAGLETTLLSVISSLLMWGIVVIIPGEGSCEFGVAALSSEHGTGRFDKSDKLAVLKDEMGVKSARAQAERAVTMARTLKAGREALKEA